MPSNRRKKYLIQPRLQLLYALVFLATGGVYVLLQAILFNWNVYRIAGSMPPGTEHVLDELVRNVRLNLLATFLLMVPLTLSLGVLVTHRVVGPLYRFELFLKDIVAGKRPPDCKLRKKDELKDFCALLNRATAPLRHDSQASAEGAPASAPGAAPAAPLPAQSEPTPR